MRNAFEAKNGIVSFGSAYVEHEPVDFDCESYGDDGVSLARQDAAEECDINSLMARYAVTGTIPQDLSRSPRYVDAFDLPSYQEALHIMMQAEQAFMALPAKVRKEFDNSPEAFVEFAQDPKNLGQMREWGLAPPEAVADAPAVDEPAKPAEGGPSAQGASQ